MCCLAFILLGTVADAAARDSKKIEALKTAAAEGNLDSQLSLAYAYANADGVKVDMAEAAKWYAAAAKQGDAEAQNSIGSLYLLGEGVPKDSTKACEWFARSAAQHNIHGVGNLGTCYDAGFGVAKDLSKAHALYEQAAEAGDLQSMLNVGVDYWQGEGVGKDLVKAVMWLDLARFYTQTGNSNRRLKWRVRGALDELSKEITPAIKAAGEALSREWDRSNRAKVQKSPRY